MTKMSARVVFGVGLLAWAIDCRFVEAADVRLNQIQVIGSHNSYHVAPYPTVRELIAKAGRGHAEGLDYSHRPLAEQFSELGIRQIELDVHADPKGGLVDSFMFLTISRSLADFLRG